MQEKNDAKKDEFLTAFEDYSDALFRFAYFRVNNRDKAMDLVQTVFLKTWNYLSKGNEVINLRPFLYTTLRNLIIDHYREKKYSSLDKIQEEEGWDPPADQYGNAEIASDAERAYALIKVLPLEYGQVIMMRLDGNSFKEIAEVFGESENTVTVRYHRGLKKLKDIFENGK